MDKFSRFFLALLFFLFAGCTRLPDYALPQLVEIENSNDALKQGITYRTLGVEDFRAKTRHGNRGGHANRLSAEIVTRVQIAEGTKFRFEMKEHHDRVMYYGKVASMAFEAVMLPDYSWWSQKIPPFYKAYTLQHEQIHFALMELAARQLSKNARSEMQNFVAVDVTKAGAEKQLLGKIKAFVQTALSDDLQRQLEFDQETSLYFDPEKQQEWFDEVSTQLQVTDS